MRKGRDRLLRGYRNLRHLTQPTSIPGDKRWKASASLHELVIRQKRQRTAALQDAVTILDTPLLTQGFGVRLSSAAFITLNSGPGKRLNSSLEGQGRPAQSGRECLQRGWCFAPLNVGSWSADIPVGIWQCITEPTGMSALLTELA
jgi:hypothetical protein